MTSYTDDDDFTDMIEPDEINDIRWVGEDKAIVIVRDKPDPYAWARRQASIDLGVPEIDLLDVPDRMPDGSDEQGWDMEEED